MFAYLPVLQVRIQFALAFMLTFPRSNDPMFNRKAVFSLYTGLAEYAWWWERDLKRKIKAVQKGAR
ncbi:hypothetical protein SDC9_188473 [bioreactor metagenome]|uniref:Uncharacterized protein n=1 Tax=bioreactor metagenome TaxID=1076179 RepID=A0A645I071_9ZZZZ